MMKKAKYLPLILLMLLCACSNKHGGGPIDNPIETTETPQPSESFDISAFPPPDWAAKSTIAYSQREGTLLFQEGIYNDRFWTPEGLEFLDYIGQSQKDMPPFVPDKETAVTIAATICCAQGLIEDWDLNDFVPSSVFFDTQDEVWVVLFSKASVGYASGSVTIVIRKDNAQVLAIWAEAG